MNAVLVEFAPPETSREHQESLLRACGVAAKPLRCVAGEAGDEPPALLAIVVWEPDGSAHIEVGVRRQERVEWADRRLTFAPGDPEKQRWEAAGLAAGTVAASLSRRPVTPAVSAPPPAAPWPQAAVPVTEEPNDGLTRARSSWGVDLGFCVASGFEGSVRAGAALALRYAQSGALRLELRGSLAGDRSTEPSGASQLEVSTWAARFGALAGVGFDVGFGELGVLAGPFVERVIVDVEPQGGRATRFVGGAELTAEFRQRFAEHFLVFLAADAGTRFGTTFVAVDGTTVGSLQPLFVGARIGVGVSF